MATKLGVVGVGGIARHHLNNLKTNGMDVEYVGFCDVVAERAEWGAKEFGGIATTDCKALYDAGPEGVLVCVPPDQHGEIEFEACKRGVHLFIEKPICLDMGLARDIQGAIRDAGVASLVAYKYRWDGFVRDAKKVVDGKPVGMAVGWFWGGMVGGPWFRRLEGSGGQLVEQATHIVDMARYLLGDIVEVRGCTSTTGAFDPPANIPDAYVMEAVFECGAVASFTGCCMLPAGGASGLRLLGPAFNMEVAHPKATWLDGEGQHETETGRDGYVVELEAFLKAIGGDRSDIPSDYENGMKTLAATLAAMKSASEGGKTIDPNKL